MFIAITDNAANGSFISIIVIYTMFIAITGNRYSPCGTLLMVVLYQLLLFTPCFTHLYHSYHRQQIYRPCGTLLIFVSFHMIVALVLGIEFYLFVSHGGMKRQRVHV